MSDEHMRRPEREAVAGDPGAALRLAHARLSAGISTWEQGGAAFRAGNTENPFPFRSTEAKQWDEGFEDAYGYYYDLYDLYDNDPL